MARYSKSITADGTYEIVQAYRRQDANNYECTLYAFAPTSTGAWGSGTIAWKVSFDDGVTAIPINDLTSVALTQTADGSFKCYIDTNTVPSNGTRIYAVLSGATNPVLTVGLCDNV